MKTFKINDNYQIVCRSENTRYGFRHLAELKNQYFQTIAKSKVCYYNRTWESFEFETVISKLLQKLPLFSEDNGKEIMNLLRKNEYEAINKQFAFIGTIAKMGSIFTENQAEANDWKKRMLKAGLPDLDIPSDWNTLSEDEKTKRLDNVIAELTK